MEKMRKPNLAEYNTFYKVFDWKKEQSGLTGLPGGKGINIAYEAVDRHTEGQLKDSLAIRFIRKDDQREDYSYGMLKDLTAKFANILRKLGLEEGERVFSLLGRVPELYIVALGSFKV